MLKSYRSSTWDPIIWRLCSSGEEYGPLDVKDKVVFDIGAHIGGFTEYALNNGAAKVFSFEANKENFPHLQENITDKRAFLFNGAAWFESGKTLGFQFSSNNINTGGGNVRSLVDNENSVTTIGLEDIVNEYEIDEIAVMKMDCEGSEFPILYGSTDNFLSKVRIIVGEYHNAKTNSGIYELYDFDESHQPNIEQLRRYLTVKGFRITKTKRSTNELGIFKAERT